MIPKIAQTAGDLRHAGTVKGGIPEQDTGVLSGQDPGAKKRGRAGRRER
jgi:hypothetical protein